MCKDSESTRTGLKVAGWLILASTLTIIIFNVFYILNYNKHKKQGVRVGTGDDPEDYDEEDRGTYLLGYILWGVVILTFNILFICCAINYDDTFAREDEMMANDDEDEMDKDKKKKKMEEMMEDMMEKMMNNMDGEMEPMMEKPAMGEGEAPMMEPPADGPEVNAEGGMQERASNVSRSSKRSGQSKAVPPIVAANDYPSSQRKQAAFYPNLEHTPRGSFKKDSNYE